MTLVKSLHRRLQGSVPVHRLINKKLIHCLEKHFQVLYCEENMKGHMKNHFKCCKIGQCPQIHKLRYFSDTSVTTPSQGFRKYQNMSAKYQSFT